MASFSSNSADNNTIHESEEMKFEKLVSNQKEIEKLKEELDFYKNQAEKREEFKYYEIDNNDLPNDILSMWINHPGFVHLPRLILGFLDVKSQAKVKKVSKTFYKFLQTDKEFAMLKIFEHKNKKIIFFDDRIYKVVHYKRFDYAFDFPIHPESAEFKERAKVALELLQYEDIKTQWKAYYKILKDGWSWVGSIAFFSIEFDAPKTFLKFMELFPYDPAIEFTKYHVVNLIIPAKTLKMFNLTLDYSLKYLISNGLKDKVCIPKTSILFALYRDYVWNSDIVNEKRIELTLKNAQVLEIDIHMKAHHYGYTVLELATSNGHNKIVDLFKKYG